MWSPSERKKLERRVKSIGKDGQQRAIERARMNTLVAASGRPITLVDATYEVFGQGPGHGRADR
jgi:23S rRNA G2445 N2-methylase RlmL